MRRLPALFISFILAGCMGMPPGVTPVTGFDLNRYLGKWYEITRLDHPFEQGLTHVTAEYTLRDDGGIAVINKGFSDSEGKWKQVEGKGFFVGDPNTGFLKISFFGPFYASYIIFELDKENYQFAFVSGESKDYLWLLSRSPYPDTDLMDRFLAKSGELGFDTDKLIFVDQNE